MSVMGVSKGFHLSFDEAQERIAEMIGTEEYAVEGARVYLGDHPEVGRIVILLPAFGDALAIVPFETRAVRV